MKQLKKMYPQYTSGLGERVIQPFVNAVQNFFSIIETNFNSIVTASATNVNILQLVLMGLAVGIIIKLLEKKQYVIGLSLGSMMIFSATRGYEFHGVAAWYLAVLIIALYIDLLINTFHKMGKPIIGFIAIILASTYFVSAGNNLLYEQSSISELESRVVEITANDENKDIFFNATCCDSLYLSYKNRKPVNPVVYMLPWYMDWYEDENVNALLETLPHVAVYNEDRAIWEMSHYTFVFDNELKTHYTRLSDVAGGIAMIGHIVFG